MKLTSAATNAICQSYKKKYQRLVWSFHNFTNYLKWNLWHKLKKNFFMANWIGLYWFFLEYQQSNKIGKKINKTTFASLNNEEFAKILANFFTRTITLSQKQILFLSENEINNLFTSEYYQLFDYIKNNQLLSEKFIEFMFKNTKLLVLFSIYDFFIQKMKFIFDYPDNQKHVYEENVVLIQEQIRLLTLIQTNIQLLENFTAKNDAAILITTLRKR